MDVGCDVIDFGMTGIEVNLKFKIQNNLPSKLDTPEYFDVPAETG